MKLNIYGKCLLEVIKENDQWVIYVLGEGKKSRSNDIVIPSYMDENEVVVYLADIFHEAATPENPDIKVLD